MAARVQAEPEAAHAAPTRPAWTDTPLRTKIVMLVVLASVFGSLLGMIEAHLGHRVWLLSVGLIIVNGTIAWLGFRWVCDPIDRLTRLARKISRSDRPQPMASLPITRQDEVGQLARAIHDLIGWAVRDHYEAKQLRRTLDDRVAAATRSATRNLEQLAMRDPLTGLGNRRFIDENLELLVESAREQGEDLVCVVLDVDNFKQVNDTLGHATGDELLIFIANLIQAAIRHTDYAVRLGGDEFVILLPACPQERAAQLTRQISALFRQHVITALPGVGAATSLSMGIASRADDTNSGRELLELADRRLYAAKRAGKDRAIGI